MYAIADLYDLYVFILNYSNTMVDYFFSSTFFLRYNAPRGGSVKVME